MRARVRGWVRPMLLSLLLLGIAAVRGVQSFPHDSLTSIHRVVTHPGQYLEDATYTMEDELSLQQGPKGKWWWRNSDVHRTLEGKLPLQSRADIPSRFSDSGGFLQLCLLLIFCLAVICCASMSITPWYKMDSMFFRKLMTGIGLAIACLMELVMTKLTVGQESKGGRGGRQDSPTQEGGKLLAHPPQRSTKKAAKGKKRRISYAGGQGGPGSSVQHSLWLSEAESLCRPLEETVSNASEGSYISTDLEVGQNLVSHEVESSALPYVTPVDAQIARVEAEALEKQMQRLAKQKKHASQAQAKSTPLDSNKQGSVDLEGLNSGHKPSPPLKAAHSQQSNSSEQSLRLTDLQESGKVKLEKRHATDVNVKTFTKKERDLTSKPQDTLRQREFDGKDRAGRRPLHHERSTGGVPQVLLVPRRTLYNKGKPSTEASSSVEDISTDKHIAPHTPDRLAVQSARSPLSSPQSMASPSRPYAEVAKENLPRSVWGPLPSEMALPTPPPPPPPRRLQPLPKSAVYAPAFTPAALRQPSPVSEPVLQLQPQPLGMPDLSRSSAPSMLEIPIAGESTLESFSNTSPFPGMSLHRKRVPLPVTGQPSNVLPAHPFPVQYSNVLLRDDSSAAVDYGPVSTFASRASSSTESDPTASRFVPHWTTEHFLPAKLDPVWGTTSIHRSPIMLNPWSGGSNDLTSEVSLASSSDLGSSSFFGHHDPPLLAMGHGGF